jgi:catechol 2,3-dioxygenase-like lactoylglutathione lyase family enzyme
VTTWYALNIGAADPARLARWWAGVLGLRILDEDENDVMLGRPGQDLPMLYFSRSLEPKVGKNRLHLNLSPVDRDAEVERLLDMGARHVDIGQDERGWVVLSDPEGNEFCLLRSHSRNGEAHGGEKHGGEKDGGEKDGGENRAGGKQGSEK